MNAYLNKSFFQVLCNLKMDRSNSVTDYLEGIHIKDDIEAALDEELDDEAGDGDYRP